MNFSVCPISFMEVIWHWPKDKSTTPHCITFPQLEIPTPHWPSSFHMVQRNTISSSLKGTAVITLYKAKLQHQDVAGLCLNVARSTTFIVPKKQVVHYPKSHQLKKNGNHSKIERRTARLDKIKILNWLWPGLKPKLDHHHDQTLSEFETLTELKILIY